MTQTAKNILMVIANDGFQDHEYAIPRMILEKNGCTITIAAGHAGPCIGAFGLPTKADLSLKEVDTSVYDMIVFVGGGGAHAEYFQHPDYLRLAQEAKAIGAICIAPTLISDAGVLHNKKCTGRDDGYRTQIQYITANGGIVEPYEVVQDGNIITANGPQAAHQFGETLVAFLQKN